MGAPFRRSHQERVVGRVGQQAQDLELAGGDGRGDRPVAQSREECPFIAGHAWPSGSMGFPQYWQVGRPRSDDGGAVARQREHLLSGGEQPDRLGFGHQQGRGIVLIDLGLELLDLQDEQLPILVVADRELARRASAARPVPPSPSRPRLDPGRSPAPDRRAAPGSRPTSSCTCCFSTAIVTVSPEAVGLQVEGALPGLADRVGRDAGDRTQLHGGHALRFAREPPPRFGAAWSLPGRRSTVRSEPVQATRVVHQEHACRRRVPARRPTPTRCR